MKVQKGKLSFFDKRIMNEHFIQRPNRFLQNYPDNKEKDRGSYLLILYLNGSKRIEIGGLGEIYFPKGFYIYVGSAMRNLTRRIKRHRRLKKNFHWHIDYLRARTRFHAIIPIPSSIRVECRIAKALSGISQWNIPKFGSSDCSCRSHLFGMENDPTELEGFYKILGFFKSERA